jgi:hypothetical protein
VNRALPFLLVAVIAAGCGSDDGDSEEPAKDEPAAGDVAVLESPRIAFTFEYPDDLDPERRPRSGTLARVAVKRGHRLNAVQVRRTSPVPLAPRRYLDEFKRDLAREGRTVTTREERIGDRDMGVLEVEARDFTSSSYFFTGAGQTWQVECIADAEHRAEIDAACRTALESVEFAR